MPGPGIEPGSTEPQSVVLPLNHPGNTWNFPQVRYNQLSKILWRNARNLHEGKKRAVNIRSNADFPPSEITVIFFLITDVSIIQFPYMFGLSSSIYLKRNNKKICCTHHTNYSVPH